MKPADKRTNEAEIRIYQSLWKNMLLVALCLAFAVVGYMIIRDDDCGLVKKMLGGWLNIIFFGGGGLFIAAITIHNRIRHIPLLVIYEERLELYEQRKGWYYSINFADVGKFRFVNGSSLKMIAVDYKASPLIHKFEESSGFKQGLMKYNFNETGAIENIPVVNLTMKGKEICDLLNRHLK